VKSKIGIRRIALVTAVAALALVGCGVNNKYTEPYNDAPRGKMYEGPADIIVMPDGYGNVATKCGPPGVRITTLFHKDGPYGAIAVTLDPNCR
jgi:hypothetical protein